MKTSIMRTAGVVFSAGVLLTSCVSSKKYHRSQDEVAKLRTDSTTLAQQASSLQQNLSTAQQKSTDLQKSVETANTTNQGLQKNVAYYHEYADKQTAATTQMRTDIATTLASAGLTDQDVLLTDGKIYINIGEKSLFKGNTANLTSKGKELVDNLGQFVKAHEAVDVSVADLQQATSMNENGMPADNSGTSGTSGSSATTGTNNNGASQSATTGSGSSSTNNSGATTSGNRSRRNSSVTNDNAGSSTATSATTDKTATRTAVAHHRRKTSTSSSNASGESKSVAYSSGHHNKYTSERTNRSAARVIAWKRQNAVADALLKTGIPKVKVVAQNAAGTENAGGQKGVQVVLVNNPDEFYKHMSQAPSGQPVSMNP